MEAHRTAVTSFLSETLCLTLHARNDVIFPCECGLLFLVCRIFPDRKYLKKQVWHRVLDPADLHNVSSYYGLLRAQDDAKILKHFDWHTLEFIDGSSYDARMPLILGRSFDVVSNAIAFTSHL